MRTGDVASFGARFVDLPVIQHFNRHPGGFHEDQAGINAIQREPFVDRAAESLKDVAMTVFGGEGGATRVVRNALFGTWLGHPLHPMIVVVPTGAWVVSEMLDWVGAATNDEGFDRAAGITAAVGMAGAVVAVASGANDWRHTQGKPSRLGLIHGLANIAGLGAMGLSLLMRVQGARGAARALATVGVAITAGAAYVGGELVYGERVGVSHVSADKLPNEFEAVMPESELPEGKLHRATVKGVPIVLLRHRDRIFGLANTCSHMGGPLHKGTLDGDSVVCPWHGSKFSLETGRVIDGPATFPQPSLEVRVRDQQIQVRLTPESE